MVDDASARIVALDIGSKRIGVATANVVARIPAPLRTLEVDDKILDQISQLLTEQQAKAVVLGLPRGLEGQETAQTVSVQDFGAQLSKHIDIPLYWQDEALTSELSEQTLQQRKIGYQKGDIDAQAATMILEDYLRENHT